VTGNWGCGCFNGDLRLKFLIQWLACSLIGKKMTYCPFGSKEIIEDKKLLEKMSKRKVG
jgi:poly(ADP-ribose) glycohydrolase